LPILNFFKVIETDDYRHILKLKDYEKLPKRINLSELEKVWNGIYTEFSNSENSNSAIIHFTTSKSVHRMELEYLMLYNIYSMLAVAPDHKETKKILKYAGIKGDIKKIEKRLKGLSNRIKIKRATIKETTSDKKVDVFEIISQIESIIGRNIDMRTTTVRQYIAIKKTIKSNGKRQDNAKGRN
jgi:hypothetical protein